MKVGVSDFSQDFGMGVATKWNCHFRAWHPKIPPSLQLLARPCNTCHGFLWILVESNDLQNVCKKHKRKMEFMQWPKYGITIVCNILFNHINSKYR